MGHQQYGNWQEYNRLYQPGAAMQPPVHADMMGGVMIPPHMAQY